MGVDFIEDLFLLLVLARCALAPRPSISTPKPYFLVAPQFLYGVLIVFYSFAGAMACVCYPLQMSLRRLRRVPRRSWELLAHVL